MHDDVSNQVYHDGHRMVRRVAEKQPTAGGAHAFYEVVDASAYADGKVPAEGDNVCLGALDFQHDTIPAVGVRAWTNESVLSVVIDRLQGFQAGEFSCRENAIALTKLQEALMWLEKRTADRQKRGVEGQHKA